MTGASPPDRSSSPVTFSSRTHGTGLDLRSLKTCLTRLVREPFMPWREPRLLTSGQGNPAASRSVPVGRRSNELTSATSRTPGNLLCNTCRADGSFST
eukprot:CAMPEP_0196573202 /NCGR_PEP_ID=MMETSP1081-20130531/3140_1 /TAXON_ID=36882 /ORGANISM="Pyramimonas amylifera, Strain CCMP720" /LENGTH=97 /DNA_ID=CAMNT_0041890831 /DNA_START=63 /DNA_END=353 /DNA_ORIENTATION=-